MSIVILSILICFVGIFCYFEHKKIIHIQDKNEQKKEKLQYEVNSLNDKRNTLLEQIEDLQNKAKLTYDEEKQKVIEKIQLEETLYRNKFNSEYEKAKIQHEEDLQQLSIEKENAVNDLNKIKASIEVGLKLELKEQKKKENLDFYRLKISQNDLEDVKYLEQTKKQLHNPVILSKLIWSTYFQKQAIELCAKVLGTKEVCGIYKITNIQTNQCYIGQSINIANRFKQHIKCGLGIDTSSTNKLYAAMIEYGVWNFTFELVEECPKEQLNEKEKMWIDMYQSVKFGYNISSGAKQSTFNVDKL